MTYTPTDGQIETASLALVNAERDRWDMPPLDDMSTVDLGTTQQYRALARAVLVAVGPDIAANTYRSAARLARAYDSDARHAADIMDERADQIEKEAGR